MLKVHSYFHRRTENLLLYMPVNHFDEQSCQTLHHALFVACLYYHQRAQVNAIRHIKQGLHLLCNRLFVRVLNACQTCYLNYLEVLYTNIALGSWARGQGRVI